MDPVSTPIASDRSFLRELLLGPKTSRQAHALELPPLRELSAALTRLASGKKNKCLLPVGVAPLEYALVRRGGKVMVSVYETSSAPEVHLLERPVALQRLIVACAEATRLSAQQELDKASRQIALLFAERAEATAIAPQKRLARARTIRGGRSEANGDVLSFGFEANIEAGKIGASRARRADVHAMLFPGSIWAFVHGRRVLLAKGPILLAVQRMVVAVRALVDAWETGRPTNVRLRTGEFGVGVRLTKDERASLSFRGHSAGGELRISEVRPDEIALPILRLASDLLRTLVREDRGQTRNLRVTSLRDEVRALRRTVRAQGRPDGFVNEDAERLRVSAPVCSSDEEVRSPLAPPSGAMRYESRWRIELDGLDAGETYFCGDRLVLSGPRHNIAVDRSTGDVLWAREGAEATLMAGATLVRIQRDGEVELCSVEDGEPFAQTRIQARQSGTYQGFHMAASGMVPVAVLAEGANQLIALDLHTGQPRWRFSARREGVFAAKRAGRILLIADDSAIHAIDAASGEDLWRFATRGRFAHQPAVIGDCVVAVAESRRGEVYGIDLYSGQKRFDLRLSEAPAAAPIAAKNTVLLTLADERMLAVDTRSGDVRWEVSDPGVGMGASALVVDDVLVTNAPGGGLAGTSIKNGAPRFTELLGDPIVDEVPRCLEPVLRGGALFVPAGDVHVVRPADGAVLCTIDGDIVPDRLRVDERGWVYAAEESGHVAAFTPAAMLRLVHSV